MNTGLPGLLTKVNKVTKTEGGRDMVSVLLSLELEVLICRVLKLLKLKHKLKFINFMKDVSLGGVAINACAQQKGVVTTFLRLHSIPTPGNNL